MCRMKSKEKEKKRKGKLKKKRNVHNWGNARSAVLSVSAGAAVSFTVYGLFVLFPFFSLLRGRSYSLFRWDPS